MKTDREMLELAAKAAGINLDKSKRSGGPNPNTGFDMAGNAVLDWRNGKTWNPLNDDGDALWLAVYLGIFLRTDFILLLAELLATGIDHRKATRRAIVCIAAKIAEFRKELAK